jgi:hypothetical protein
MVVLRINVPVEFSSLYTTRSSARLTFKQLAHKIQRCVPQA